MAEKKRPKLQQAEVLWPHSNRLIDHLIPALDYSDLSILLLKGHLMVELATNELLADILTIDQLPQGDSPLEFDQKLSLVRAYVCSRNFPLNADILDSIKQLNKLRNAIAHHLIASDDLELRVENLVIAHQERIGKKLKPKGKVGGRLLCVIRDAIVFLVKLRVAVDSGRAV